VIDISKLVVGQHVTLSDALPGEISRSEVTEVTKWYVAVEVYARLDGVDGGYTTCLGTGCPASCPKPTRFLSVAPRPLLDAPVFIKRKRTAV
jgi:hypothetical protein